MPPMNFQTATCGAADEFDQLKELSRTCGLSGTWSSRWSISAIGAKPKGRIDNFIKWKLTRPSASLCGTSDREPTCGRSALWRGAVIVAIAEPNGFWWSE
jgi:hypothetical protein